MKTWSAEQQREDKFVAEALQAYAQREWHRDQARRLRKGIFWTFVIWLVLGAAIWLLVLARGQK
jgi:fatty acid desaturase